MDRSFPRLLHTAICLSLSFAAMHGVAKAVDFGWKELPGGGIEYQVQVEPELIPTYSSSESLSRLTAKIAQSCFA